MVARRKKAHSTGVTPIGGRAIRSRRVARLVTSSFHDITRSLRIAEEALQQSADETTRSELRRRVTELKSELQNMGGRHKYQEASIISTKHHQTSKWFLQSIKTLSPDYRNHTGDNRLRLLEVGAINTQLLRCPWLRVRALDLNSQHPGIEEADFLEIVPEPVYDFVVCSMVVNCVPEPARRGEMLARLGGCLRAPTEGLPRGGVLFLALPTRFVAGCNCGRCLRRRPRTVPADRGSGAAADGGDKQNVALEAFLFMLGLCGLEEVAPRRDTPKLAFFTLARSSSSTDGSSVGPKPKGKGQKSSGVDSRDSAKSTTEGFPWRGAGCVGSKAELLRRCSAFQQSFGILPMCLCDLRKGAGATPARMGDTAAVSSGGSSSSSSSKLAASCVECGRLPCASVSLSGLLRAAI